MNRSLYDSIDFDHPFDHPDNAAAAATPVESYLCPTAIPQADRAAKSVTADCSASESWTAATR